MLQLNLEIVVPILHNMKISMIKQIFMQRKVMLDKVLNTQFQTNNKISGSYFSVNSIENESVLNNPQDARDFLHVLNYLDFSNIKRPASKLTTQGISQKSEVSEQMEIAADELLGAQPAQEGMPIT